MNHIEKRKLELEMTAKHDQLLEVQAALSLTVRRSPNGTRKALPGTEHERSALKARLVAYQSEYLAMKARRDEDRDRASDAWDALKARLDELEAAALANAALIAQGLRAMDLAVENAALVLRIGTLERQCRALQRTIREFTDDRP